MEENEVIHVKIESPSEIRKNILKCALDTIEILKGREDFKKINHEEMKVKKELERHIQKLTTSVNAFSRELPVIKGFKTTVKEEKVEREDKEVIEKKEPEIEDRLNVELDEIRSKIENLKF